ncbi:diacylglycerol kinase family protein [Arthrobacter sp. zg-Y1219]|uniref:diacylglycerol/lipid kinase family protein n=1 Tax=Arthrobacter sp. zg-Y1219 TaxID=3049067 RepID=UPI0024C393BF|nr:diacylglycerol kinase family protein [Arthrobacter sp. zg-Y1219]MDK1360556.1 diacylglycerol kinase family protein [Arthrobacter sp. zg-Y1219]
MPTPEILLLALLITVLTAGVVWAAVRRRRRLAAERPVFKPLAPGHQRVAMVLNPVKVQAPAARVLLAEACELAGWDPPLILETTRESPGWEQARHALQLGADVVVAAGGDGTIREVARALANAPAALGLLPLGTGNLLARNLGLPVADLPASVRAALHGQERRIDMGTMTLENSVTGQGSSSAFLVMGGIGLDAEVLAATRDDLKKRVGWMAYSEAGVRLLPGRRTKMSISVDGEPPRVRKVRSILFANIGRLPAGIDFIPEARMDDGLLDVVVMSPRGLAGWLWLAGKVVTKYPKDIPVIDHRRARTVEIRVGQPTRTQLDGDVTGAATSVRVQVNPLALLVRAPAPELQRPRPFGSRSKAEAGQP